MSRNETEFGTIHIPPKQWSHLKKAMVAQANSDRDEVARQANILQEKMKAHFKGKRNVSFFDAKEFLDNTGEELKFKRASVWLAQSALKGNGYQSKKITQALINSCVPKATTKTERFEDTDTEFSITLRNDKKIAFWHIPENNHAVEEAKQTNIAHTFLTILNKMDFGNKYGGTIYGNNEHNRDDGDGMNYVVTQYGHKTT